MKSLARDTAWVLTPVADGNGYRGKDLMVEWWGTPWWSSPRFYDLIKPKLADAKLGIYKRDGTIEGQVSLAEICRGHSKDLWDEPQEAGVREVSE